MAERDKNCDTQDTHLHIVKAHEYIWIHIVNIHKPLTIQKALNKAKASKILSHG